MSRIARYLLPALVAILIVWQYLAPSASIPRDLILYNAIWAIAMLVVALAPLTLDRVAVGTIALAIFLWGLGSLASSIDQLLTTSTRFTLTSQLLYSIFYPLLLIAIPRFSAVSSKLRPIELLDALIFGLGFTSIASALLFALVFPQGTLLNSDNFFLIFYPVADLLLLLVLAITVITRLVDRHNFTFAIGILLFTINDLYYLWLAINHRYSFGGATDEGWLIAVVLIAISTHLEPSKKQEIKPIHPALVALAIFISPILLAISALRPQTFPIYIVIPSVANLLLAFIRMSTALREARTLIDERNLARTDELTGLANRRRLLHEIESFSDVEGALLLMDLDKFKPINDQFGHEVGDLLLREVAKRFSRSLPEGALLARLGGDEFGVLIPGSIEVTLDAAYALRASLSYPCLINGREMNVGVSIGHVHNDGAGALLKRADEAMYRAKQMDMGVARS